MIASVLFSQVVIKNSHRLPKSLQPVSQIGGRRKFLQTNNLIQLPTMEGKEEKYGTSQINKN